MPTYVITAPDGNEYEVDAPEGATMTQVLEYARKNYKGVNKDVASVGERFAKGAIDDPITGLSQALYNALPEGVQQAGDRLNNYLAEKTGLVGEIPSGGLNEKVRQDEQAYQQRKPEGTDWARVAGGLASPVNYLPATRFVRAASGTGRVAQGVGLGAVGGLMNPVTSENYSDGLIENLALGGITGGLATGLGESVSRVISPRASTNADVKLLQDEGVRLTPGMSAGGYSKKLEEASTSIPLMGGKVQARAEDAMSDFNRAAINRAGNAIGIKANDVGFDGFKQMDDAVSKVYERARNAVGTIDLDQQFFGEVQSLQQLTKGLDEKAAKQFANYAQTLIKKRSTPQGKILPQAYKEIDSEIGNKIRLYSKSQEPQYQALSNAFKELQSILRRQASRSSPEAGQLYKQADTAYAQLVRIGEAVKAAKNNDGVFTPAQLNSAIQKMDSSVRGRNVQKGDALLQDLARAGQKVMGNRVPNSGTPERAMVGGLIGGASTYNPMILAGPLAGMAAYSSPVNRLLTQMLTTRPQSAQAVSNAITQTSPILGLLAPQVLE